MLSFSIDNFHYFSSLVNDEKYELAILSKMQARRMTNIGKIAVDLALKATRDTKIDFVVYASRHGEVGLSHDIITSIVNDETPSPMKFSQSTHNAVGGLYSIYSQNTSPMTAIAAGPNSFTMGLVSALNYLKANDEDTVLYLFADAKVPEVYVKSLTEPNENIVIAMTIKKGNDYNFIMEKTKIKTNELQSSQFINWFLKPEISSLKLDIFSLERH